MAILLLNRLPRARANYVEWFADLREEIYMLAARDVVDDFHEFPVRMGFDTFASNGMVEIEAIRLQTRRPFRAVIALEESEIIRAGRIRSRLGIHGQGLQSAFAFRNKVIMKQLASAAGIPVASFRQVTSPLDVHDFVQEHGFPVVIKPVSGMFSVNTAVLRSWDELGSWFRSHVVDNVLVEAFVDGSMYHINGVILDGRVRFASAAAYINTCLGFTQGRGVGNVLLPPDSSLSRRLVDFTVQTLAALPTPDVTTFHCEVFVTSDNRIVLCEIASRTSGGGVPFLIEQAYGLHLDRYIARAQCGLVDPLPDDTRPRVLCANYFIPPMKGVLQQLPTSVPVAGSIAYRRNGRLGQSYDGPTRSGENIAEVVVEGETEIDVRTRLEHAITHVVEHSIWVHS